MKLLNSLFFLLIATVCNAQTIGDPCDSIFIHSVIPNATGEQIEVMASNHSLDIMSYPGFILFNENGDTIAVEDVNYFGIGWNEQLHILNIINQPTLPMTGLLELHTHFYDSLRCSWSWTLGPAKLTEQQEESIQIAPNPAHDWIEIQHLTDNISLEINIYNAYGEQMKSNLSGKRIDISSFPNGIYHLEYKTSNSLKRIKFIVL